MKPDRKATERPPRIPRPPRHLGRYFDRLWPAILRENRVRPMGAKRTVRHPDGDPVSEESEISFRVPTPDLVEPLLRALDLAVQHDAAAWGGYDGWTMITPTDEQTRGFLFWPGWLSLEVFWERK